MTQMLQSMRRRLLECHKFNALPILLALILHDRFYMVFGITVNPLDSIVSSSFDPSASSNEYTGFASEVHDLNNIDYSQFGNGFNSNKYLAASSAEDHTIDGPSSVYVFGTPTGGFNQKTIVRQQQQQHLPISENQSDGMSEFLKMFSIPLHHSVYEFAAVRPKKLVRPAPPPPPSSPISAITDGIKDRLKAIYPGTLWCGDGTHAKYQNEVGIFRNTDICCKQHDECPAFIKSGSEFKGLRNTGLFTRSHCDCDMKFFNCLKRTDSLISSKIGYTYFNILRPQCFRKEFPIVGCKKRVNNKCVVYMIDDQQTPVWQWFENKLF